MKTKKELPACPVATAVSLIGGKWKPAHGGSTNCKEIWRESLRKF